MKCYVFKVRKTSFRSKRDEKQKTGYNVGLLALEGSKFHLETFIDAKDSVFLKNAQSDLEKVFAPGFWEVDVDEFEVFTPNGSQYQKKIISITKKYSLDDCRELF